MHEQQGASALPEATTLRARHEELCLLRSALGDATDGRGGAVVLVEGTRGSGKTRLLHEAAALAAAAGARAGHGAARRAGAQLPMGLLLSALVDGSSPLLPQHVSAAVLRSDDLARRLVLLEAKLHQLAQDAPLLLCLDDLQWADPATTTVLHGLCLRTSALPVVWVLAHRSQDLDAHVADLVDALRRGATTVRLQPLPEPELLQLLAAAVGAAPGQDLRALAARTAGDLRLLDVLVQGLLEESAIRVDEGQAELLSTAVPRRVREAIDADLSSVSALARRAAVVTAVLGRAPWIGTVAEMLDARPAALLDPLRELVRLELLILDGHRVGFRSDLVREAVVKTVPASIREELQRHAIEVLLQAGQSPLEPGRDLAHHAASGDRRVVRSLTEAARGVAPSDADAATELLGAAVELCAPGEPQRPGLVAEHALLLHSVGRAAEGRRLVEEVRSELLDPVEQATVLLSIARMTDLDPRVRTAAGHAAMALPALPRDLRSDHAAEWIGNLLAEGQRCAAGAALVEVGPAIADAHDVLPALEAVRARLAHLDGDHVGALRHLESSTTRATDLDDHARLGGLLRGDVLVALDQFEAAKRLASDAIAGAARSHRWSTATAYRRLRGRALLQEGRLHAARATLRGTFDPGRTPVHTPDDAATLAALGRVALHSGDAGTLRALSALAEKSVRAGAAEVRRHAGWLLSLAADAHDDPVAARRWVARIESDVDASPVPLLMADPTDIVRLMRIALRAGDDDLARTALELAERPLQSNPDAAGLAASAAHARGLRDGDPTRLQAAAELFGRSGRTLAAASALEDLGTSFVRSGDRHGAVDALSRALRSAVDAGATWDASRVRRRLRALGVRRRIVPARSATGGWSGLTDAELRVVRLVAEGLSNREVADRLYLSPHTVSMHLRHVFTKLGINSRVDLARVYVSEHRQVQQV